MFRTSGIEIYSTHNKGKLVVADRFIRTFKIKFYKYMTSISKNVYIDKLDHIVNEYHNASNNTTYNRIIHVIAQLKWKLLMQNQTHILTLVKKLIIKIRNLKLAIMLEYQNIEIFLQRLHSKLVWRSFCD